MNGNGPSESGDFSSDRLNKRFTTYVTKFVGHFETKLAQYCDEAHGKSVKESKRFCVLEGIISTVGVGLGLTAGSPGAGGAVGKAGGKLLSSYLAVKHHAEKADVIYANLGQPAKETVKLRATLVEAATDIFHSFEMQFVALESDKGDNYWHKAMHYLAVEAVERILDHSYQNLYSEITPDKLTRAFLLGKPKQRLPLISTRPEVTLPGTTCNISEVYDKVCLLSKGDPDKYYKKRKTGVGRVCKYGYRLKFKWEDAIQSGFEEFDPDLLTSVYKYVLEDEELAEMKMIEALGAINDNDPNFKLNEIQAGVKEINTRQATWMEKIEDSFKKIQEDLKRLNEPVGVDCAPEGASVSFEVRREVECFTGRDDLLQTEGIYGALAANKMVALVGIGGVGKRELARRFASRYNELYLGNIVWINCSNQSNMMTSFGKLAKRLACNNACDYEYQHNRPIPLAVRKVHTFFGGKRCLFIFDDVRRFEDVADFLPCGHDAKPHVLMTTRNEAVGPDVHCVRLKELAAEEAAAFVREELDVLEDNSVQRLVSTLHCLPLALQMAMACVRTRRQDPDVADSVSEIDDYLSEMLGESKELDDADKVLHAVISFSLKSMREKALGKKAMKIMEVVAFLSSDNVPRKIFSNLLVDDENRFPKEERQPIICLLAQYSMVTWNAANPTVISTRSLVQENIRQRLPLERRKEVLRVALVALRGETAEEHIMSIWDYATDYFDLVNEFLESSYGGEKNSILHLLARNGRDVTLINLLNNVQDNALKVKCVNACNKSGNSVMHLAAKHGFLNIVQYLETQNASVNVKNVLERTPFHESIVKGQLHIIKYFAEKHNYEADRTENLELVCCAATSGNLQTLRYFVEERGFEFLKRGDAVKLHVHEACKGNKLEIVKYLLGSPGASPDVPDKDGNTPLHVAAQFGHLELIKWLVGEKKVNVCCKNRRGNTPVYSAVKSGHMEVVEYFFKHDETLFKHQYKKQNLLHEAAYNRKLQILQYLTKKSVLAGSLNAKNSYGNTPLHEASCGGDLKVVKYLVESLEADVEAKNNHGKTALHRAAASGKLSVVKYFIEDLKLHLDAEDDSQSTPLHEATYGGSIEVVKYLIGKGADIHKANKYRKTPLFGAVKNPHFEVMQYLIEEKNCLADVKDYKGRTPLQIAENCGNKLAVDYLRNRLSDGRIMNGC